MNRSSILSLGLALGALACGATERAREATERGETPTSHAAWSTIYSVLQNPRCANCHPADGIPKQGDASLPHAQNVQAGADGNGRFAMRCDACHQTTNLPGLHLPPGAPNWHLPAPAMPLVFAGRSSAELCRQLKDPKQNGGRTPAELYEHMAHDPLVLWGWSPGPGRAPVPTTRDEFVRAVRAWVDGGCGCPE
jgi:cytochrome c5